MVDAKSLDAQWRMHVVPNLGQDWRLIFFWGQVVVVMAHGEAREAIEEALSDCSEQERVVLEPLAFAYLSTDAQLAAGGRRRLATAAAPAPPPPAGAAAGCRRRAGGVQQRGKARGEDRRARRL